jgi:hypothetical protein
MNRAKILRESHSQNNRAHDVSMFPRQRKGELVVTSVVTIPYIAQ